MCFQILFLNICIDQNLVFLFCYDHFFISLLFWNPNNFKVSRPRAGPLVSWEMKIHCEVSRPRAGRGPTHSEKSKKICSWKKSFFLKKYFFLFLLWTYKLFWWKVWILCCIWQANLIEKAYIPNSVAAFFSRFRKFQNDCRTMALTVWLVEVSFCLHPLTRI